MPDQIVRLACILALIPLTCGTFLALGFILQSAPFDSHQVATLAATALVCGVVITIWRRFVRWSAAWWTYLSGSTALLIGHIVLWVSLLAPVGQCDSTPEFMRFSQSATLLGLWCAGFGLVAWGSLLRRSARRRPAPASIGGRDVTPNVARLAMAISLFPSALGFYIGYGTLDSRMTGAVGDVVFCRAGALTASILVAAWLLLWRRSVDWTRRRIVVAATLAAACVLSPALVFLPDGTTLFGAPFLIQSWEVLRYVSPLFLLASFLAGTARSWRAGSVLSIRALASRDERGPSVVCRQCGYSLRGLREVRCPECGWSATVDELVASVCMELTDVA